MNDYKDEAGITVEADELFDTIAKQSNANQYSEEHFMIDMVKRLREALDRCGHALMERKRLYDGQQQHIKILNDTAGKRKQEDVERIDALERELVKLGDKVQRTISALQAGGSLRGFKP